MKPIYAKENGHWNEGGSVDFYSFLIKFKETDEWQNLIIKIVDNNISTLMYSINRDKELSSNQNSWVMKLMQAAKNNHNTFNPRTYVLHNENGQFSYVLMENQDEQIFRKVSPKLDPSHLIRKSKLVDSSLEPRIRPFGTVRNTTSSISSFFGLDRLIKQEKASTCLPPTCLTISLEVLGGFIAILGIAAIAVAFTVLSGSAVPVVFAMGTGALLLGIGLFSTGIARHLDCKSILNDEPNYVYPPRNV
ncbi:MAG: hypothetical protein H0U57_08105 [Tatlockia sp.]|nr:hypothetical protein [Tatlockia sp.]